MHCISFLVPVPRVPSRAGHHFVSPSQLLTFSTSIFYRQHVTFYFLLLIFVFDERWANAASTSSQTAKTLKVHAATPPSPYFAPNNLNQIHLLRCFLIYPKMAKAASDPLKNPRQEKEVLGLSSLLVYSFFPFCNHCRAKNGFMITTKETKTGSLAARPLGVIFSTIVRRSMFLFRDFGESVIAVLPGCIVNPGRRLHKVPNTISTIKGLTGLVVRHRNILSTSAKYQCRI
jgi:hypothetical protein